MKKSSSSIHFRLCTSFCPSLQKNADIHGVNLATPVYLVEKTRQILAHQNTREIQTIQHTKKQNSIDRGGRSWRPEHSPEQQKGSAKMRI